MIDQVRSSRPSRWARLSGLLAALALPLLLSGRATADLTIEIQPTNTNAVAGSTNNVFDILLVSDSSTPSGTTLSSFNVSLSVASGSGISFTGADTTTSQTYVFASDNSGGFTFSNPGGANTANIFDIANDLNQPIAASTTYGLGEIFFSVDPGAIPGAYPLTISPTTTSLTGGPPNFFNLTATIVNGQITVTPSAAVPEPLTLVLMGIGLAFAGSAWLR